MKNKEDEMATTKSRIVDQPGQWKNVTPKATKKKQAKAWAELEKARKAKKK